MLYVVNKNINTQYREPKINGNSQNYDFIVLTLYYVKYVIS